MPDLGHSHKVHFQKKTQTQGDAGEYGAGDWAGYFTTFAEIEPMAAGEIDRAKQVTPETTHRIRVDWCSDLSILTSKHRIVLDEGGRILEILGIKRIREERLELVIDCKETSEVVTSLGAAPTLLQAIMVSPDGSYFFAHHTIRLVFDKTLTATAYNDDLAGTPDFTAQLNVSGTIKNFKGVFLHAPGSNILDVILWTNNEIPLGPPAANISYNNTGNRITGSNGVAVATFANFAVTTATYRTTF